MNVKDRFIQQLTENYGSDLVKVDYSGKRYTHLKFHFTAAGGVFNNIEAVNQCYYIAGLVIKRAGGGMYAASITWADEAIKTPEHENE